jgi:hypothetical protein
MAKDKKSEKKAAAPKVKADKKATTAKVPALTKDILKKAVSTFNYFQHSIGDDVFLQKVQIICSTSQG